MRCPSLNDLPAPPPNKTGWPWTEETAPSAHRDTATDDRWPGITVVTPSFNQGAYIEETIRSVLLQAYANIEYFVLDGGSTDNSVEIIRKYSPWLSFWVSERDGGQSAAINRGLRLGTGQHAAWVNSDDLLCKSALVTQAALGIDPDVMYAGECLYVDSATRTIGRHRGRVHSFDDLIRIKEIWRAGGNLVQPEVLFPRERAVAVGGLNEADHYTMDYELWGRLLLDGVRLQYTEIPFGMFRHHQAQKTQDAIRQTEALVGTAERLLARASHIPNPAKEQIRADLRAYLIESVNLTWKNSGRLAKLGLPASLVKKTRNLKNKLQKAVKSLGDAD